MAEQSPIEITDISLSTPDQVQLFHLVGEAYRDLHEAVFGFKSAIKNIKLVSEYKAKTGAMSSWTDEEKNLATQSVQKVVDLVTPLSKTAEEFLEKTSSFAEDTVLGYKDMIDNAKILHPPTKMSTAGFQRESVLSEIRNLLSKLCG